MAARGSLHSSAAVRHPRSHQGAILSSNDARRYTAEQAERLRKIHARMIEARRELDALIGDAYLRSRASIVPVHFLDLASAVEKLRWAEKEWRELDRQLDEEEEEAAERVAEDEVSVTTGGLVDVGADVARRP